MSAAAVRSRAAHGAAERRRKKSAALRHRALTRIFSVLGPLTLVSVLFLGLQANVTRMNYEYTRLAEQRAGLIDATSRLDNTIAYLESRERLAKVAARLGMVDARVFSVAALEAIPVEAAAEPRRGIAFLPAIASWLR